MTKVPGGHAITHQSGHISSESSAYPWLSWADSGIAPHPLPPWRSIWLRVLTGNPSVVGGHGSPKEWISPCRVPEKKEECLLIPPKQWIPARSGPKIKFRPISGREGQATIPARQAEGQVSMFDSTVRSVGPGFFFPSGFQQCEGFRLNGTTPN